MEWILAFLLLLLTCASHSYRLYRHDTYNDFYSELIQSRKMTSNGNTLVLAAHQKNALKAFYTAAGGSTWDSLEYNEHPWDFTNSSSDPCNDEWYGIGCSCNNVDKKFRFEDDGVDDSPAIDDTIYIPDFEKFPVKCNVTVMVIKTVILKGYIPSALGQLSTLEYLYISNNNTPSVLSGSLPESIGNLTSLVKLSVTTTSLTGPLPATIGNLTQLTYISLWSSKFTSLPDSICGLPNLISLAVSFNKFKSLPSCLGNMSHLNEIWAQDCNIATIPNSWYGLTNLSNLYLDTNSLTTVSPKIMQLANLMILTLGKNRLTAFPPINNLDRLTVLDLSNNDISGVVPLLNFGALKQILIGGNNFTGDLHSFRNLLKLEIFIIDDNSFSGSIIDHIYDFSSLRYFSASKNKLTGILSSRLSSAFPKLEGFVVDNNRLSGSVPDFLLSGYYLKQLDLSSNMFTGEVPFVNCSSSLRNLNVGNNYFTGGISIDWFNCSCLQVMDFSNNSLSGKLPDSFDKLKNLSRFYGYRNLFESTFPSTLAQSTSIKSIWLQTNNLKGSVPSLSLAVNLEQVFIHDNYFSGSIKFMSSANKMLQNVDISQNLLTGRISDDLLSINSMKSFSASSNCLFARLTDKICNGSQLSILILDGIHSACAVELPKVYQTVYASVNAFTIGLPQCLYEISTLQQLHLSGNGLDDTLPPSAKLSPSFRILQLSNNDLRGPIPDNFQSHGWTLIDLSDNKLSGSLSESLNCSAEMSLHTNRISGQIPSSLYQIKHVDVLESNFFDCSNHDLERIHDHAAQHYDCGSDTVNTAGYAFSGYIGFILLIFGSAYLFKTAILREPPVEYLSIEFREKFHDITLSFWTASIALLDIEAIILRTKKDIAGRSTSKAGSSFFDPAGRAYNVDGFGGRNHSMDMMSNVGESRPPSLGVAKTRMLASSKRNRDGYANIDELVLVLVLFRKLCYILCAIIIIITLPLYLGLSSSYGMYKYKYFFSFSIAYLSGMCPAVLLFFFTLAFVVCFLITDRYLSVIEKMGDTSYKKFVIDFFSETSRRHKGSLILIGIINLVAVSAANVAFVKAHDYSERGNRKLLEIAVALFKVIWVTVIYRMLIFSEKYYISQKEIVQDDGNVYVSRMNIYSSEEKAETSYLLKINTQFLTYLTIFNNLMMPAVAVMILSPKCFKHAIFKVSSIESSYLSYFCKYKYYFHSIYEADLDVEEYIYGTCTSDFTETILSSYIPPYIYTYECASSILRSYCPVFMYEVLMLGMTPVFQLAYLYMYRNIPYVNRIGKEFLDFVDFLPTLVTTIFDTEGDFTFQKKPSHVFEAVTFMVHMVSLLSILLTFGLAFPPLGLITAFAIVGKSYFTQLQLGYFLTECLRTEKEYLMNLLDRNLKSVILLLSRSIRAIFIFMVSFFGLFLFDIVGDSAGSSSAISLSIVFICISLCLNYSATWIANNVIMWYKDHCNAYESSTVQNVVNWCQKHVGDGNVVSEIELKKSYNDKLHKDDDDSLTIWTTNPLKSLDNNAARVLTDKLAMSNATPASRVKAPEKSGDASASHHQGVGDTAHSPNAIVT